MSQPLALTIPSKLHWIISELFIIYTSLKFKGENKFIWKHQINEVVLKVQILTNGCPTWYNHFEEAQLMVHRICGFFLSESGLRSGHKNEVKHDKKFPGHSQCLTITAKQIHLSHNFSNNIQTPKGLSSTPNQKIGSNQV